jgi:anti-sigma factor RsiW
MIDPIRDEDLHAFVDDQLSDARRLQVMEHLEETPADLERVADYIDHKTVLRDHLRGEAETLRPTTRALASQLAARLARRRWRTLAARAAMVAALLAAGWVANMIWRLEAVAGIPPLVVDAADGHRVFADDLLRPVELPATARAEMASWFSSHLGAPVEIPVLGRVGYRLIGGRMLSGEHGPVAQLLYEDAGGARLTLCLALGTDGGPEVQILEVDEDLAAGYWQDGEVAYALVGDADPEQLMVVASVLGGIERESLF